MVKLKKHLKEVWKFFFGNMGRYTCKRCGASSVIRVERPEKFCNSCGFSGLDRKA